MALRRWLTGLAAQAKTAQKLGPAGPAIQRQALRDGLRYRLQQNPALRFESLTEIQMAAALGVSIDANRAGIEDWLRLPGLSIHQARLLHQLSQSGIQFHCTEDIAAALSISHTQVAGWDCLLQFCFYDPEALEGAIALDLNQAPPESLLKLPGITASLVQGIVTQRQQHPFSNWIDVKTRLQLPAEQIESLMHYLKI